MPEQPLPPPEERISLRQAAEIMGKTPKALQQLVARGSLDFAREDVNPATGRAARVVTTEAWVREYMEGGSQRASAGDVQPEHYVETQPWREDRQPPPSSERYWQEVAEGQAVEILRLRARIAELERRR